MHLELYDSGADVVRGRCGGGVPGVRAYHTLSMGWAQWHARKPSVVSEAAALPPADMLRTDDLIGRLSVPLRSLDLTPGGA